MNGMESGVMWQMHWCWAGEEAEGRHADLDPDAEAQHLEAC